MNKVFAEIKVRFWDSPRQRFVEGYLESYSDESQIAHITVPGSGITFWLVPYRLIRRIA